MYCMYQLYVELFSFERGRALGDLNMFAGPPKRHLTNIPVLFWEERAKILVKLERKQKHS